MRTVIVAFIAVIVGVWPALAWDPIGDITNPGRIIRNIGREVNAAGQAIDRARIEAQANAAAPAFQQWLEQSRNTARSGGVQPIPPFIRSQIEGFYDRNVLDRTSFKIGDGGSFNLANLSMQYGGASAVTLVDVIVFRSSVDAMTNTRLWVHELKHIKQFRDWGTRDFAIRYLRSWNSVEGEAYAAEREFEQWKAQRPQGPPGSNYQAQRPPFAPPAGGGPSPYIAAVCATPYGMCQMGAAIPVGTPCICPTSQGAFLQGIGR